MLKKKIFFKKYKLNQLQKIKQIYKYIYFFLYIDLNINEIKNIKDIKKDNIKITYNHKDIINLIEDDFKKNYEQSYKYNNYI